jgi:hypothetical protein
VFAVEETEPTLDGRADALLRLVECVARGDERREPRYGFDAPGTVAVVETFAPIGDGRQTPVRIADVARGGVAFLCDRRFEAGENLDVAFEDEGGGIVRCRVQIVRVERAVYGRTRYAARLMAIGQIDQARLDRICNRARLRDEAAEANAGEELPIRELLGGSGDRRSLRRLFGRA